LKGIGTTISSHANKCNLSWWGSFGRWIERNLLSACKEFMGPSLFSTNTKKIKIVQVMGNNIVHGVHITLTTNSIPVENVHCSAKTRNAVLHSVIFGRLPVANEGIMSRGLILLYWCHPSPNCSLESKGCILLYIFRMA